MLTSQGSIQGFSAHSRGGCGLHRLFGAFAPLSLPTTLEGAENREGISCTLV